MTVRVVKHTTGGQGSVYGVVNYVVNSVYRALASSVTFEGVVVPMHADIGQRVSAQDEASLQSHAIIKVPWHVSINCQHDSDSETLTE